MTLGDNNVLGPYTQTHRHTHTPLPWMMSKSRWWWVGGGYCVSEFVFSTACPGVSCLMTGSKDVKAKINHDRAEGEKI